MQMDSYTVIARKYRPQTFSAIVGQEHVVTTIKNSLRLGRTAHAYLLAGPRGTGKTTIARLFAKASNCQQLTPEAEPCNACPSCKDITQGKSLDVLEIDGASNRGIDDIRTLNETVHYATSSSRYRIYIIDEVHMLTKEAFNALLKTLEEPPPNVKFFMATTEPQRIPPTIISRCQRFDLSRIRTRSIADKLQEVCRDLGREAAPEALRLIAHRAEGGLRDAESLLDQILSFSDSFLSTEIVAQQLGLPPSHYFFSLDEHFAQADTSFAFTLVEEVLEAGYDPLLFLENLAEHYRMLLLIHYDAAAIQSSHFDFLDESTRNSYVSSSKLYTLEQCLFILDFLVDWLQKFNRTPHTRIALECILSTILRSKHRVSLDVLVKRMEELEEQIKMSSPDEPSKKPPKPQPPGKPLVKPPIRPPIDPPTEPKIEPLVQKATKIDEAVENVLQAPTQSTPSPQKGRYENIIHFAAVELEGSVKINTSRTKK